MAKFNIVRKKLESKHPGVTLLRIHFKSVGNYAVMYKFNNNVLPFGFRTLQEVIDQFDLDE